MATYTELRTDEAAAIGRIFGLRVTAVVPVVAGSVNSNYRLETVEEGAVFARIYEEQDRAGAEGEARLLAHLAGRGVMTPRPIARADGSGFTAELERAGRAGGALSLASGRHALPGRGHERRRARGRAAARVASTRPARTFPSVARAASGWKISYERLSRIEGADAAELRAVVPELREELRCANAARRPLPGGIVHGDLISRQRPLELGQSGRPSRLRERERRVIGVRSRW